MTGRLFTVLARGVLLLVLCAVSSEAQVRMEKEYCNARFGFCFWYPVRFEMDPPPENDDGRVLRDGDGCVVTAWGGYNVLEETLEDAMTLRSADFDTVTYRAKGKNWFVLSGYRGSDIVYLKLWVGPDAVNGLEMAYPSALKKEYDAIVTKIVRSFRPGDL
ncbi:MAG: hypothetical protein PHX00_05555 [Synergistaceae bacterium]|nr:hypothetical protein [Synergistaceae bacterium]